MAAGLVGKADLVLETCCLSVEWLPEPHLESTSTGRVVMVTGLKPSVSNDSLMYFLESSKGTSGGPISKVTRRNDATAVVEFENPSGA